MGKSPGVAVGLSAAVAVAVLVALTGCSSFRHFSATTNESPPPAPQPRSTASDSAADGAPRPDGAISWSEAADHVGETQKVCGPLAGSGYSDDDAFLNLGLDYPDPGRFQIVIWDVGHVKPIPLGSTVCTTGRINLYEGVGEIELTDSDGVLVYD